MGVDQFQIQLTNSQHGVYNAGDWIQGHVVLNLNEPTKCTGVILKFYGGANVHWTERHSSGSGKNRRTTTRHYRANETYFNNQVFLWGDGRGGGLFDTSPQHPAGQHVYPFNFQLPPNLPSSYESYTGRVRYSMECVVDRPWKFDHKTKLAFTVNTVFDLNQMPQAREPRMGQQMKTLCCLCCKSGPITNKLQLERGGYVPGEFIVVNGEVDNKSNRNMTSSSLKLRQITTYFATTKSKSVAQDIVHLRRATIPPGESEIWTGEKIHIPPLPPSELLHCGIINIKYYVVLVADPSGPAFDLEAPCEVTIGTVPLQNIQHMYANSPFQAPNIMYPPPTAEGEEPPPPPSYTEATAPPAAGLTADAPPPSYAQYALGQVDIRDQDDQYTHGNMNFAPQYTYYTWNK